MAGSDLGIGNSCELRASDGLSLVDLSLLRDPQDVGLRVWPRATWVACAELRATVSLEDDSLLDPQSEKSPPGLFGADLEPSCVRVFGLLAGRAATPPVAEPARGEFTGCDGMLAAAR